MKFKDVIVAEQWSQKYKNSINCSHPKGFSQKAHCAGKKKHNESVEMEMVCEDCGMCQTHGNISEIKQRLDAKCWKGKHKEGTKIKGGIRVNNCVPNESVEEAYPGHVQKGRELDAATKGIQANLDKRIKQVDSLVTDALKLMRGPEANDAVRALKTVLGDREYNQRRGHYNFYVRQLLDMYGQQGVAEGQEDRRRFIRHNIWTAMDSDEEVLQHAVEGDPFYSAKKFMRDLDDQGYDFTHVISPEGEITYSPQHDPRHLKNFPEQGVAEAGITRRGFLQGAGAAAVAGAAGGVATKANAQDVAGWANYAAKQAVKFGGGFKITGGDDSQGGIENYIYTNVHKMVSYYCVQTNSYNAKEVIDYANAEALKESGLDKTIVMGSMTYKANQFVTAYRGALMSKIEEWGKLKTQQVSMALTKEEEEIIAYAVNSYYFAKEDGNEAVKSAIAKTLNKAILAFNIKNLINEWYKNTELNVADARRSNNPNVEKHKQYFLQNYQQLINNVEKLIANKTSKKDEFESIEQGVAEDYDSGEYNDEAGMAQGNLHTIAMAAQGLLDTIDDRDNLPEWAQEKIAKVEGMLVTVWNYLQSQEAQGIDPEVEEMYEAMDQLAEEMAAKKGVSADLVWETFEAMDDHMLYETAAWRRKEGKSKSGGLNAKGVASYRREHPGSKLQTAVTTKPSKLKPGSKAAKRRKSFCARMSGVKGPMKKPNGKPTRKALALRKWNC